jgi:hypothetical protein
MCLILSVYVTSALNTISFALLGINVDQPLDVITALIACAVSANQIARSNADY